MSYVYLKTQSFTGSNLSQNTIPLNVTAASVSVSKTIPAFPIPLSGVATGESVTTAFDLGMASKSLNLSGFIQDATITKTFKGGVTKTFEFTAQEIAQMIASGVDSTGFAQKQAFSEIVLLIPSNVDSNYLQRSTLGTLIPLTFASRGGSNEFDNEGVPLRLSAFPDSSTDTGLTGFIRSFSFNLEAESIDVSFSLDFEIATVIP